MKEPKFVSVGNKEKEGMYCIVRTENAGVFAGTLESIDDSLRMAMENKRNCVGIELNESYITYAKKRLNWGMGLGVEYNKED
jgi:hypothetical protein